jgi:hypothetical protein
MCFEGAASVGVRADVDLAIGGVLGYCLYARFGVLETKHKSGESSDILSKTFETVQPRRFSVPGISIPSKAARSSVHVIVSKKPTCPCDWRDVGPEFARWIFPFTTYCIPIGPFWYEIREYRYPVGGYRFAGVRSTAPWTVLYLLELHQTIVNICM